MNSLFLPARVDWDCAWVDNNHYAGDHLVLLKKSGDDDRYNVQGILVIALKLSNHDQQFVVSKYCTAGKEVS